MGLQRTFLDAGQRGYLLLSEATRHGPLRSYAKHLLEQRVVRKIRSTAPPIDEQLLTRREQSVLSLLVHHHSTQEIAMTLQITPSTVKKHISNIYGKLHVTNRREAVQRARELGLVHA
ncbi:MAG: response regulator transcription factor [Chloroflexia bacterium]|nr:response regulator transcription factor [Chloroflexia bacterium]